MVRERVGGEGVEGLFDHLEGALHVAHAPHAALPRRPPHPLLLLGERQARGFAGPRGGGDKLPAVGGVDFEPLVVVAGGQGECAVAAVAGFAAAAGGGGGGASVGSGGQVAVVVAGEGGLQGFAGVY